MSGYYDDDDNWIDTTAADEAAAAAKEAAMTPDERLKRDLGNEYDLYSNLKTNFQGFDKAGNAVFKDENNNVTSFNKNDFSKLNSQLQKDYGNKSYEDKFNQDQYNDIASKGNKFQGFAGNSAIFRNEKGDLENFGGTGGFASFLKKQQPNAVFDATQQGNTQRSSNEYGANVNFLGSKTNTQEKTGSGFTGYNPQIHAMNVANRMMNPSVVTQENPPVSNPNIPTPGSAVPDTSMPKAPAVPKASSQNPSGTFATFQTKQKAPVATKKTKAAPPPPPTLGSMATNYANKQIDAAKTNAQNQAQSAVNEKISDETGLDTLAITNPQEYAKQQAMQSAKDQAQNIGGDLLSQYGLGDNSTLANVGDYAKYASVLNGNVLNNAQTLAKQQAIQSGKEAAVNQAAAAAGLDPTGGMASGALNTVNALANNGDSTQKGDAAARAAAQTVANYYTAGLANPALLNAGAGITDKLGNKMGSAGVVMKPTSVAMKQGAQALNTGLDTAGTIGGGYGRSFGQSEQGLKDITKGNIEEGLAGLGKGAINSTLQTFLKNPATIAQGVGKLGQQAVAAAASAARAISNAISWVCFTPDTEILMANGKYKKIKQIKLGEEVMLGGKVTAIGTAMANDLYLYDGVQVSKGHALYEDKVWTRVENSKYAVELDTKTEFLVYPMATENHLVVTKGQVWADIMETDNKHNVTEDDRINDLNNQKQANQLIDVFLASYFKKGKK